VTLSLKLRATLTIPRWASARASRLFHPDIATIFATQARAHITAATVERTPKEQRKRIYEYCGEVSEPWYDADSYSF
jgi:hypothetical protein